MDYDTLIDAETWAFIRETEAYYPPDTTQMSVADQRAAYDRMCRAFFKGYPDGITVTDGHARGVPIRVYEKGTPIGTVVYFHGGGFIVGGLESHDDVCAEICDRTGLRVVSADYRLCPEHPHPASYDDAVCVVQYVSQFWPGVTILAGDSAGGNLAAAAAQTLRHEVPLAGLVLIYPGLGGDDRKGSYIAHANAPMLTLEEVKFYSRLRRAVADDATAAPLAEHDFSGMPPTVAITAQCDPLSDDGKEFCDRITAAGGKAHWHEEPGLVHGYLRARSSVSRARESFDRIIFAVAALSQRNWPF